MKNILFQIGASNGKRETISCGMCYLHYRSSKHIKVNKTIN